VQRAFWWIAYGIVTAACLALPIVTAIHDREKVLERALTRLDVSARLLDQHASAALRAGDLAVRAITKAAENWDQSDEGQGRSIWRQSLRFVESLPQISSIWLLDAEGRLLMDDRSYTPAVRDVFADRPYFVATRERPGEAHIGEVAVGTVSGQPRFTISRAIVGADARFAGTVSAGVYSDYFAEVFREMGAGTRAVLLLEDGRVLAKWPFDSPPSAGGDAVLKVTRNLFDHPITVTVSASLSSVLQEWWQRVVAYAVGGLTAFIGFSALTFFGLRTAASDAAARMELREANAHLERRVEARTFDLRKSEARVRLAMDAATLHAFEWTAADDRFERVAPHDEQAFGLTSAELGGTGRDYAKLIDPADREIRKRAIAGLNPEAPSFTVEYRLAGPDGGTVWVEEAARGEFDESGRLTRLTGVLQNITRQKEHELQVRLLMREVNHRSKNMLALVQAIACRTAAGGGDGFVARFTERIMALAASQDLLVRGDWREVELEDLVRSQLAHFHDLLDRRVIIRGGTVKLSASAAQTIGMALHELATNAAKYGALSIAGGHVEISWDLFTAKQSSPVFEMSWREVDGPPVKAPDRHGFGLTVIDRMVRLGLDADVDLRFAASGLEWRMRCPAASLIDEGAPAGGTQGQGTADAA
jgi:PAS domain S-box-containing protein